MEQLKNLLESCETAAELEEQLTAVCSGETEVEGRCYGTFSAASQEEFAEKMKSMNCLLYLSSSEESGTNNSMFRRRCEEMASMEWLECGDEHVLLEPSVEDGCVRLFAFYEKKPVPALFLVSCLRKCIACSCCRGTEVANKEERVFEYFVCSLPF